MLWVCRYPPKFVVREENIFMSIIKPRDGFINVVNMSLCSDYLKKKLKEYG